MITDHCSKLAAKGQLLFSVPLPESCKEGTYVSPAAFRLDRFDELSQEIFGPVLHVLTYRADELDKVVDQINESGYGLTLGVHSRVDERIDQVCERACVGNIYVNRNQIGAVVGVQPFGGEGLSGTGPKAGGPSYLFRFTRPADEIGEKTGQLGGRQKWREEVLPGPTGERNTLHHAPRGLVACLGAGKDPDEESLRRQVALALETGNAVALAKSTQAEKLRSEADAAGYARQSITLTPAAPTSSLDALNIRAVLFDGDSDGLHKIRRLLASRDGIRIPVLRTDSDAARWLCLDRVVSEDTTAAGGNTLLLAEAESE